MERKELLKQLTGAFGPSGYEAEVAAIMKRALAVRCTVQQDKLGSVVGEIKGRNDSPKIMFAAHMDEIGFVVESVTKGGFIKFLPIGGWWEGVLPSQRVLVRTRTRDVVGVIGSKPPHDLKEDERKKIQEWKSLYIDVGVTKDYEVKEKLGIRPGDPIVPIGEFTALENSLYLAKAWDDRVGCGLLVEAAERIAAGSSAGSNPNTVYLAGTTQEEVGLRGAKTAAALVNPDVAFAVDVSTAKDTPGEDGDSDERLKNGVAILVYDLSMIPSIKLRDFVIDLAEKHKVTYHLASVRGGYDTGRIHLHSIGVPSLALGIPTRYIHSHNGIIAESDYENTLRLITLIAENLTGDVLNEILK
jgi:endoglucanase